MGYAIGTLTKGGGDDCHYKILGIIKILAEANGWTTLRYVNTGTDRELILKGVGLSGAEEIFVGFKTYLLLGDFMCSFHELGHLIFIFFTFFFFYCTAYINSKKIKIL